MRGRTDVCILRYDRRIANRDFIFAIKLYARPDARIVADFKIPRLKNIHAPIDETFADFSSKKTEDDVSSTPAQATEKRFIDYEPQDSFDSIWLYLLIF